MHPPGLELARHRSFRSLLRVRLVGQVSDGLLQAGLVGVVLFAPERAPSPTRIVVGFAVLLLPFCLVAPLAGVLLDRWSRVRALTVANLARSGLITVTAVATALHWPDVVVFGAALLALALNRLILAALGAALPRTLPTPLLVSGNALAPTLGTAATVVGAGLGLALRGTMDELGEPAPFAVAALGYLAAAASATRFATGALGPDDDERRSSGVLRSAWDDVLVGTRTLWSLAPARRSLALTAGQRLCFGALTLWSVSLVRFELPVTSNDEQLALAALGAVALAVGVGLLAAALLTPRAVRRWGARRSAALGVGVAGVGALVPALGERVGTLLICWLLVGFGAQTLKITVDTVLQRTVPDDLRGRVFIAYDIVFNAAFVLGAAFVASFPGSLEGTRTPVAVAAVSTVLAALTRLRRAS